MALNRAELREFFRIAVEALGRYKLRTSLSVLGVVLGVAAVIAMMSVSEGAAREAIAQVDALGLDNLVAQTRGFGAGGFGPGLSAGDADRAAELVPLVRTSSPLVSRYVRVSRGGTSLTAKVLGVRASFQGILRLSMSTGRFLSATDERRVARACVLGAALARQLFGYRAPVGEFIRIGPDDYEVVGVLREAGAVSDTGSSAGSTLAWHDLSRSVLVPFPTLSGRTLDSAPAQPADEIWLQVADGTESDELGRVFERVLARTHAPATFQIIVPRELLAQRQRTQRTFSVVVGSVAALALIVGGIGIMNIMLTSVIERTREIGIRRTVGATRRDVTSQFLVETLIMTLTGGAIGIAAGVLVSWSITAFAGWTTHVSITAVLLGFFVSFFVGLVFGLYPAVKAGTLEPVDAMRFE